MTTFYRNTGSAWAEVVDGSLQVDFAEPSAVFARSVDSVGNPVWLDTGYQRLLALPVGTRISQIDPLPFSAGTRNSGNLVVSWSDPLTGWMPTEYWATVYRQDGTLLRRQRISREVGVSTGAARSATFPIANFHLLDPLAPIYLTADSNYYVQVEGTAPGYNNSKSSIVKFRTGHDAVVVDQPVSDWLPAEESAHPVASSYTSRQDASHSVTAVTDDGPAGAGPLAPFTTQWISDYHPASTSPAAVDTYWEGLSFTMPPGKKLLTKVQVVTEPAHTLLLGINKNGTWLGASTAADLGIAATGYRTAAYAPLLVHNYAARHTDHTTNLKVINTTALNVEFADIDQLVLAVKDFIAIGSVGGSAGTPVTTVVTPAGPSVAIPADAALHVFNAQYSNPHVQFAASSGPTVGPWASDSDGHILSIPLPYVAGYLPTINGTATSIRWYKPGTSSPSVYYKDSSGNDVTITLAQYRNKYNTPGSPAVTTTKYVGGSAPTPAWRARISDVTLFYKSWGVVGTQKVTTTPAVATAVGPTAW